MLGNADIDSKARSSANCSWCNVTESQIQQQQLIQFKSPSNNRFADLVWGIWIMWSTIANLKENLNKIALDVHYADDDEDDIVLPSYGIPPDGESPTVSDRRSSRGSSHSNSIPRSPASNGITDHPYASEVCPLKFAMRLRDLWLLAPFSFWTISIYVDCEFFMSFCIVEILNLNWESKQIINSLGLIYERC